MDKQSLLQLEGLRGQMMDTANRKQTLMDHDVLILSQLLDQIIVKVQAEKVAMRKRTKTC
ncbi:aspartyl-phosphate phosphatase Spo0E family protein [Paenibacillus abyssi]|uniref:Aspartyl-phosphate phosphatase Spo0E family protein n=1 Tax=Paenibacillus abyssi TaxID=1340531 RepID=A0A917CFG1_9BACL|nr:aspartyl-phosphate phosphatase Spo0E family protein [Paenibacillus abyssi]GGF87388.1 hypothetical protein GCM10010916_00920 [Paenibacillus abyssi]